MPPYRGHQSVIGLGNETTWGTAVTRTKFLLGLVSGDPKLVDPALLSEAFRARTVKNVYRGVKHTEIELELEANYIGDEFLLYHLFGSVATTHPGTLAYQHTFTFADTLPKGLSVEAVLDGQGYLYDGCKVARAVYKYEVGKIARRSFSLVGKDETTTSPTSTTFPTFRPILFNHVVAKLDTVAFDCRAAEISIDTGLLSDRGLFGSRNIGEPSGGRRKVTGFIEIFMEGDTWRAKFRAGTAFKLNLTATDSASSIESGQAYTDDVEVPACQITYVGNPVQGPDYIMQRIEFEAIYDVANSADAMKETLKTTTVTVP